MLSRSPAPRPHPRYEEPVYRENVPSPRLVHDFGFQFDEQAETGAQTWVLRFPLAQVEE